MYRYKTLSEGSGGLQTETLLNWSGETKSNSIHVYAKVKRNTTRSYWIGCI